MRFKKKYLFLIILLLAFKAGVAQHYNLKKITKNDGLSGSSINCIIQDSKGYMWIASQEGGLCRYDGKKFKTFTKQDGLPTNDITAICEDDNNNIWIGTAKGVACYDGLKVKLIKNSGLDTSQINSIYKDKKNNIWFATQGNGWIKFDGKQYTQFTTLNGLPTNDIFCTLQDKEGNYWVGTYHFGVCKIQALSTQSSKLYCKIYKAEDGIGSNNIFSLLEDRKGNIWLGSTTHFISTISSKGEIKRIVVEKEYENDCVYKMVQDDKGAVWAATEDHGLFKINDYSISNYSEKEGFPSHQIYSLCIDNEANIWAGTLGKGVCVFKNEAFLNFNENDGLSNSQIVSIYQLNSRLILIGTNSGLCYYDEKKIISVNEISDLKNEAIRSISSDNDGNIWLGTDNGITIIRKKEKFEFVKHIDELDKTKISIVFSIIKSHTGVMWVATSGQGLFSINGKEIKNYKAPKDLPSDELFSLFEDDKNTIWIGLVKGGAAKFDGSKFTFFNKKNELSDNTIENINQDKKGNILFATAEGGLFCYDGKTFHNITVANGISSNIVNSTLSDPYNADIIWLGTANGLNRIKIDANFKVVSVKVYNDQNGLFGNEIGENSMLVDNQKNIWIGGPEGLSKFNTTLERVNSTPPVLVLSGIRLFYQTVDWSNYTDSVDLKTSLPVNLDLNYKNNHLTFDFQALSADNNIKYQFKLDGFDANWSPLSATNEAIYSNIPSGKKYTFRAKAMNGDGLWSNKDIEYRFIIESPLYLRWWFIALVIAAIT